MRDTVDTLHLDEDSVFCFARQSQGYENVEVLVLYPHAYYNKGQEDGYWEKDGLWDKVGQAVGNLQALKCLQFSSLLPYHHEDFHEVAIPDGEILARILSHMRQKVRVDHADYDRWDAEAVQALARGIRGHPTITSFDTCFNFPFESMDSLYAALATLPALESVTLSSSGRQARLEDESTMAHYESLTELLRAPCLRSFCFGEFSFTPALCRATANALMGGTTVTKLEFIKCTFASVECAAITTGLSSNTSVRSIIVHCENAREIFVALSAALTSNSTLRHLDLRQGDNDERDCLSPAFSALGQNTGLKTLIVSASTYSMDEELCTAMQNGLEMNETLGSLELNNVYMFDDTAALWCRAFSFLRTNKTLKSLKISMQYGQTRSHVAAFRIDIAAMLQENTSLESLTIQSWISRAKIKFEEYFVLVTALQHNTTLKTLSLYQWRSSDTAGSLHMNDDEDKHLASLLKKNYALESLPDIDLENEARDVGAILQLNKAGRRYLVQDGSSISKGVEVLSRVNNDMNCVFLHLLENPRLCDRSAVERVTADESNGSSSTNPTDSSGGGKREQASTHENKESRRRLA
jgi:hypothetical protein